MTNDSIVDLRSGYAVYWEKTGQDRYGDPEFGVAEEIRVQVEKQNTQTLKDQSEAVSFEYLINVPKQLVMGSVLWLGKIADLPSEPDNLIEIVDIEEYADDTGLLFDRWIKGARYGDTRVPSAPSVTSAPTISQDYAYVGETITATAGSVTGSPIPQTTFQWYREGVPISGATGSTYEVVADDLGLNITVKQTSENTEGTAEETSDNTLIPIPPAVSGIPTISGVTNVGAPQTASPATVTAGVPTPTRTWQWNRDGSPIAGETSDTYVLTSDDLGSLITVTQTETNVADSESVTSSSVTPTAPPVASVASRSGGPVLDRAYAYVVTR